MPLPLQRLGEISFAISFTSRAHATKLFPVAFEAEEFSGKCIIILRRLAEAAIAAVASPAVGMPQFFLVLLVDQNCNGASARGAVVVSLTLCTAYDGAYTNRGRRNLKVALLGVDNLFTLSAAEAVQVILLFGLRRGDPLEIANLLETDGTRTHGELVERGERG